MTNSTHDTAIVNDIRMRLHASRYLRHADEVAASVRGGHVTLRGTVGGPQERRVAIRIANSVAGVESVTDALRIDLRDRWEDNEVRGAALQALIDRDLAEGIDVSVVAGWLTLKGEVAQQSQSNAAFEAVRCLAGIGGVTNKILVVTPGAGR